MEDLNSKSLRELQDVARTLGLTFSRVNKEELREKIKSYTASHSQTKTKEKQAKGKKKDLVSEDQKLPNEILSTIQNMSDYETAKNMSDSNNFLNQNFDRTEAKRCRDFVEYLISWYLLNGQHIPNEANRNIPNIIFPTKTLNEMIIECSEKLRKDLPILKKEYEHIEKLGEQFDEWENGNNDGFDEDNYYEILSTFEEKIANYVPFYTNLHTDAIRENLPRVFYNFMEGKNYREI